MKTEDLINELTLSVPVVPRNAAVRRLVAGLAVGAVGASILLLAAIGARSDLLAAVLTGPFWMKWAFTLSLATSAFVIVRRLSGPDGRIGRAWWGVAIPIAIAGMMGATELVVAQPDQRLGLWLGLTAARCPTAIFLLSVPIYLGLIWSFRTLAPGQLRFVGAATGFLAGAVSATIYALSCPEHTAAFLATWYSVGLLSAAALGATAGPRLLRW